MSQDLIERLRDRSKYSMNSHGNDIRLHIEAAKRIAELEAQGATSDAARYEYLIDCEYQAAKKYLPGLVETEFKAKLRSKHDAAIAARN